MHVTKAEGFSKAPPMYLDRVIDYPAPAQTPVYKYARIPWSRGDGTYPETYAYLVDGATKSYELRNPFALVYGQGRADDIKKNLESFGIGPSYKVNVISDLRLDVGDEVPIAGKYTADAPRSYKLTRIEHTYDGDLVTRMEGY